MPASFEVEPAAIASARQLVRRDAAPVTASQDKRGFQLLHWPPARPNGADKPVELSLEHEARLMPTSGDDLARLKASLAASIELASSNALLPRDPQFSAWTVERFSRDPGMQSQDCFWESASATSNARLIPRKLTLRERVAGSSFMTWLPVGSEHPLNLELPFETYGETGVVARLEFNWFDTVDATLSDFASADSQGSTNNPLVLASRLYEIGKGEFKRVLMHSTFREKYLVKDGHTELFHLNVDHVVSQSLTTHRIASFTDVDIAPTRFVDLDMLTLLVSFTLAMRRQYNLVPVDETKALTGARMTNEP